MNNKNYKNTENNQMNDDNDDVVICTTTEETSTPFRIGSVIKRTPPSILSSNETVNRSTTILKTNKQEEIRKSQQQQQLAKDVAIIDLAQETVVSQLAKRLGQEIDSLVQYVEPRNNVHKDIKRMCSTIKKAHTNLIMHIEMSEYKAKSNITLVQQRETPLTAKRDATSVSAKRTKSKMSPKKPTEEATKSPDTKKRKSDAVAERLNQPVEEWTKVQPKKKASNIKKGKSIRPRADAIIIEKMEKEMSYAEILRTVKSNEQLKNLGNKVKKLRRTQKGDLLIELKKSEKAAANECCAAIEKVLENVAKVNLRSHNVTIQCRGLIKDLNTDDELFDAIEMQAKVKRPDKCTIKSRRKTYGGTESTYLMLPAEDAKKVLARGHLIVGWTRCQVTEVTTPQRCFRCWAYDHLALKCKGPDRTNICRRCGNEGHRAANCNDAEKCVLCEGAHTAGSGKCPRYKEALQKIKA
ncbi:uncharacterized protein LOC119663761 [Teleopsis dalmanni]|uniref:uncharacterized protein LOC119663761 n=1 Tax=Teleopsis dalmanni TaxID=139649 RepID=UPI0018CF298A|nr:uncharacterized protein LOC119663761 [Teleopsis dalmanni]